MSRLSILLLLVLVVATVARTEEWAKTVDSGIAKTTTLQFYLHDIISGSNPSAVPIARTAKATTFSEFGTVFMADDDLTVGPDPKSKLVGRFQGLYGSASQSELALIMAMSFSFTEGVYNGSTISINGKNPVTHTQRELAVVGGTGVFRMVRGYALATTYSLDFKTGDAVVGYNVTLLH